MSSNAFQALLIELLSEIETETKLLQAAFAHEKSALVSGDEVAQLVACAALGSMVSKIYTKAEDFFSKIAKKIDQDLPSGEGWHIDLLRQMKTATGDRPAFLSAESFDQFDQLRRFRHFERNSYSSTLSPELIPEKVELVLAAIPNLQRDFAAFSLEFFGVALVPKYISDAPRKG